MPVLTHERSWQVWDELRAHEVRATYHGLTGRVRIVVDGEPVAERSGWKVGLRGTEIPFPVRGRQCALVVRPMAAVTGGEPDLDLVVDGWSVDHGTPVATRFERERAEPSAIARLFLVFLAPIAIPAAVRGARGSAGQLEPATMAAIVAAGVGAAAIGWWLLHRWTSSRPPGTLRTLGQWAIVATAYLAFFVAFGAAVALS